MDCSYGILIHGGAGSAKIKSNSTQAAEISKAISQAASLGFDRLTVSGHGAVDAVESAVASMEDSGTFNAGKGSCLTLGKKIEMDAAIMDGRDLAAGSIGMVENIQNPVKLARLVMERTDHVLLVSDGAMELGKLFDVKTVEDDCQRDAKKIETFEKMYRKMKIRWRKNFELALQNRPSTDHHFGTVGAVAVDKDGNVASAVSTGGRWLKMHGRIGDSAIIGAGLYADNDNGAVCATGDGEFMIRLCLCKYACDIMKSAGARQAGKKAIGMLTKKFGTNTGGIITVDSMGRFGAACNTGSMPIALVCRKAKDGKEKQATISMGFNKEEIDKMFRVRYHG